MDSLLLGDTIRNLDLTLSRVRHHNKILLLSVCTSHLSSRHTFYSLGISLVEVSWHRLLEQFCYILRRIDECINLLCAWLGKDSLIRLDGDVGIIRSLDNIKVSHRVLTIRDLAIADDIDGNSLDGILAIPSTLKVKLFISIACTSAQARL